MAKSKTNNKTEKALLTVLSLVSVGLLVAIVYVWYSALTNKTTTKPGDFLKTPTENTSPAQEQGSSSPSATPDGQTPSTSSAKLSLRVGSPENQSVVTAGTLTVSGVTSPLTHLTITGGKEDVIGQADETGQFSEKVSLNEGDNLLTLTAFDESGNETSQSLEVIYTP